MRGEYHQVEDKNHGEWELPPRARRIRIYEVIAPHLEGTTSACAENTIARAITVHVSWNYLRVRGEYGMDFPFCPVGAELPPRARRILEVAHMPLVGGGTTSACAENTE